MSVRSQRRLTLEEGLLVVAALLAPLDLALAASFTVHDLLLVGIAFLVMLGRRRLSWLPPFFLPAVFVFVLFALISSLRATNQAGALTQLSQFVFVFFVQLPVVLTVVRTPRVLRLTLAALVVGSLVGLVLAFVSHQAGGAGRIVAFYSDNPNRLGYPTAYLLPFVLHWLSALWRRGRRRWAAAIGAPILYLMIWALAASASRGAALGLLVSFVLYAVFFDGVRVDGRTVGRVLGAAAAVVAVALVLLNTAAFPVTLKERIDETLAAEESLVDDRARLAAASLRAVAESPLVGTGLDNFRYVAERYEPLATPQAPHNMWLQFLAQVGVIGTLGFLFLMTTWFELVLRRQAAERRAAERELLCAFVVSMATLMVIFMTTPVMIHRHYWLVWGLGAVAALGYPDRRHPPPAVVPPSARLVPS
jgi:O-antigen ligase